MKKNFALIFLLVLCCYNRSLAQAFRFLPDRFSQSASGAQIRDASGSGWPYDMTMVQSDLWRDDMKNPSSTWASRYTFKSVQDIVRIRVNQDIMIPVDPYRYKVLISMVCYSPSASGVLSASKTAVLYLNYNKGQRERYTDQSTFKFSGYHAFTASISGIYRESTPGDGNFTILVSRSEIAQNFFIESEVHEQRDDLVSKYIRTGSAEAADKRSLDVYGILTDVPSSANICGALRPLGAATNYKPASYELEWTYVDDYQYNVNTGTKNYGFSSGADIQYNFRKNGTRVQLDQLNYTIPLIYEHGAIVFRFRMVRPKRPNYKDLEYGAWTLPDAGTLSTTGGAFPFCSFAYIIDQPHSTDSLNWQYTINFAEQGKYKHVINYFDGSLKDRQTQTKINSNPDNIVAVEKVYDYEGRPSIVSLPTPVSQEQLYYRNDILTNNVTGKPYQASDFDVLPGCSQPDSISILSPSAQANIYYSPSNPYKSGMQQYVPDAAGFPMVQTIYSPDNTNKVSFQGGAGEQQQLWKGHGTRYEYVRAVQPELNKLMGTEVGYQVYYPKQIVTDPNGQSSYSILNPSGKVIVSALQGAAPASDKYPINPLDNFVAGEEVCTDLLKGDEQQKDANALRAQATVYNDAPGNNKLTYSVKTFPFYTGCSNKYLWVNGDFDVSFNDDCGTKYTSLSTAGVVGQTAFQTGGVLNGLTADNSWASERIELLASDIPKGKFMVDKKLGFSKYTIDNLVKDFVKSNEPACYHDEPYFVRQAVEATVFPCATESENAADDDSPCDVKRKQMIRDLSPGGKYALFEKNEDGTFKDQSLNSIFTLITETVPLAPPVTTPTTTISERYVYQNGLTEQCRVKGCSTVSSAVCDDESTDGCGCGDGVHAYTNPCCSQCLISHCRCIVFLTKERTTGTDAVIGTRMVKCEINESDIHSITTYDNKYFNGRWQAPDQDDHSAPCNMFVRLVTTENYAYCSCGKRHPISKSISRTPYYNTYSTDCTNLLQNYFESAPRTYDECPQNVTVKQNTTEYIPALAVKYRYQANCITYPASKLHNGVLYTDIAKLDPQTFIDIFDDELAEALLSLHPEYCDLKACEGMSGDFERKFEAIETFQEAEALGMFLLDDIVSKDPYINYANGGAASNRNALKLPFNIANMAGGPPISTTTWTLDKLALRDIYCGTGNDDVMRTCAAQKYADEINTPTFINDDVKQRYFTRLQASYLGNRALLVRSWMDENKLNPNCPLCGNQRMSQVGPPIFPPMWTYNPDATVSGELNQLPVWKQNLYNAGMSGGPVVLPAEYQASNNAQQADMIDVTAGNVLEALKSCNLSEAAKTNLLTNLKAQLGAGVQLSPDIVKTALTAAGISINDLCHPFLVSYGILPDAKTLKADASNFACGSPALYSGLSQFLNNNRNMLKVALDFGAFGPPVSAPVTISPSTTNAFELRLLDLFGTGSLQVYAALKAVTGCTSCHYMEVSVVPTVISPVTGITINIIAKDRSTTPDLKTYINSLPDPDAFFFDPAQCLNSDPDAATFGLITQKSTVAAARCSTCLASPAYYIWNSHIDLMTPAPDAASMQDAITCVDIKNAIDAFKGSDKGLYGYSEAANHPLFEQTLNSYLNKRFNKQYTTTDYRHLMEGCAVTDRTELKNEIATVQLQFNNEDNADNFILGMNRLCQYQPRVFRYRSKYGPTVVLLVDLNPILPEVQQQVFAYINGTLSVVGAPPVAGLLSYVPHYTLPNDDNLLFTSVDCSFSLPSAATGSTIEGLEVLENGVYQPYKMHLFHYNAATPTAKNKADLITQVNETLHGATAADDDCNRAYAFWSNKVYRSADYATTLKQQYLDYVYGLAAGVTRSDLLTAIDPAGMGTHLAGFSTNTFTYDNPDVPGSRSHLYAIPSGTPPAGSGITLLKNTIFSGVLATGGIPFPDADQTDRTDKLPSGTSGGALAIFRKANGNYWYRYFAPDNKAYNVYLVPPSKGFGKALSSYSLSVSNVVPGPTPNTFFATLTSGTVSVTCTGHTDFPLLNTLQASNVILDQNTRYPIPYDSLDCERDLLEVAVTNGRINYQDYFNATVSKMSTDMMNHLLSTSKDTLIYCGRQQQYQYTLYYYDLAGNLARTIPPAGVKTVFPYLQPVTDRYRDSKQAFTLEALYGTPYSLTFHQKASVYQYNSLNQLKYQKTPDGGTTYFFYDAAGRQIFSQNSKQRPLGLYSYSLYDGLGRPMESGEVRLGCIYPATSTAEFDTTYCTFNLRDGSTISAAHPDFVTYSYDENTYSYADLVGFVRAKSRNEVVRTVYDEAVSDLGAIPGEMLSTQENLRNRVAAIRYYQTLLPESYYSTMPPAEVAFGTYYSYDLSGNVNTISYEFPMLTSNYEQRYKRVDYDYDLVSGKVNMISYNRGHPDQFFQQYNYDADNRITEVTTSNDGLIWNKDARYTYYLHGPLASLKLGNQNVQSLEYAYTIQGWLKAINSDVLDPSKDMGRNGLSGDAIYPKDVIAHALRYYDRDYTPIGTDPVSHVPDVTTRNLYNGNITQQTTGIGELGTMTRVYEYDQLQRLKLATNTQVNDATATLATTPSELFKSTYAYDLDGNITALGRWDGTAGSPVHIDNFSYTYENPAQNNRLKQVTDITATPGTDLQPGQPADNYSYDRIGNLTRDKQGAELMEWDHFGKVVSIRDTSAATQRFTSFWYDGKGNRIWKNVIRPLTGGTEEHEGEYYVRDAGGNLLTTYRTHSKFNSRLIYTELTGTPTTGGGMVLRRSLDELIGRSYPASLKTVITTNHSGWISTYTTRPISFYLSRDPTLKSNLLFSGTSWIDALRSADAGVYKTAFLAAGSDVQPMFTSALDYTPEGSKLAELFSKYMSPFVCEPLWASAAAAYSPGDRATIYTALTGTAVSGSGTTLYDALATVDDPGLGTGLIDVVSGSSHSSWLSTYTAKPVSFYMSVDPGLKYNLLNSGTTWIDALRTANPGLHRDALLEAGSLVKPVFDKALTAQTEGVKLLQYYSTHMPSSVCQPIWSMVQAAYVAGSHAANATNLYNRLTVVPQQRSAVSAQLLNGLQQNYSQQMPGAANFYNAFIADNTLWQSQLLRVQQGAVLTLAIRQAVTDFGNEGALGSFYDTWSGAAAAFTASTPADYKINTLYAYDPVTVKADMSAAATRAELATLLTGLPAVSTVGFATKLITAGASATAVRDVFTAAGSNPAIHTANAGTLLSRLGSNPGLKLPVGSQMTSEFLANHSMVLPESESLIAAMIADNTLWQSGSLRGASGPWTTAIRTMTYNYVPTATLTTFFDGWSGGWAALDACTTPEYKLNAVYDTDPATTLSDMSAEASATEVVDVLSGMGDLTTAEFGKILVDKGANAEKVNDALRMGSSGDTIKLAEHHIYGSSRLGVQGYDTTDLSNRLHIVGGADYRGLKRRVPWYSYSYADVIDSTKKEPYGTSGNTYAGEWQTSRNLGRRYYELTDHLGNVLATVLDRKTGVGTRTDLSTGATLYDHWEADIASSTDYYPGGMMMPGRNTEATWSRMGYNGQAKDDEVYGKGNLNTAKFWEYDTRINRRWNLDPVDQISISNYAAFANNPIIYTDVNGDKIYFQNSGAGSDMFVATANKEVGKNVFSVNSAGMLVVKDDKSVANNAFYSYLSAKAKSQDEINISATSSGVGFIDAYSDNTINANQIENASTENFKGFSNLAVHFIEEQWSKQVDNKGMKENYARDHVKAEAMELKVTGSKLGGYYSNLDDPRKTAFHALFEIENKDGKITGYYEVVVPFEGDKKPIYRYYAPQEGMAKLESYRKNPEGKVYNQRHERVPSSNNENSQKNEKK